MLTKTHPGNPGRLALIVILMFVVAPLPGCRRNVRMAGKHLPSVNVRTVTHYGVTLDQDASPEEVVFVLLRALRDDVNAATDQDRSEALAVQYDVAAVGTIVRELHNPRLSQGEAVYSVVKYWAPTVAYYVENFDFDLAAAAATLVVQPPRVGPGGLKVCVVSVPLADPSGDPAAAVTLEVLLAREKPGGATAAPEGEGYWRIARLLFQPQRRPDLGRVGTGAPAPPETEPR